jgi:hypothetical protein
VLPALWCFLPKPCMNSVLSHACLMACPFLRPLFYRCNNIWHGLTSCISSLCSAECWMLSVVNRRYRVILTWHRETLYTRISASWSANSLALRSGFGCIWIKDYTASLTTWTWVSGHDSVLEATQVMSWVPLGTACSERIYSSFENMFMKLIVSYLA